MPDLSSNNRNVLLAAARESIRFYLETGSHFILETAEPELNRACGCFVTLRIGGRLRGCVGTFDAGRPLAENIPRMAFSAAFQDTRFSPLSKRELPLIRIEISVLGALERMTAIEEIELGKHGILIRSGTRSGTFLPDVAIEHRMSREEFVMICAREKAGLAPAEIAHAELFRYEVEKFSE
jgi:AmmeMemoRadiSam system protein A